MNIPSDPVSVRIVPSLIGRSRLIVSTDFTEYRVANSESWRATTWIRSLLGESGTLDLKQRSLLRANLLVFGSVCTAWPAYLNPTGVFALWMPLATVVAMLGTVDTCRHLRKRWDFRHAGVLLMIYADLMAVMLLAFLSISNTFLVIR